MDFIYIGKIVSTHGIKGEIKIISNFDYKSIVFKSGINIYIGNNKLKETIVTYRHHKNYEMITLEGYNNINEVLKYIGEKVYILKSEIEELNEKITKQELIDFDAYLSDTKIGIINDIYSTGNNYEVVEIIKLDGKKALAPYSLIDKIDTEKKHVIFKGGIIDA